jgi:RHH-type proline utilization regulon transcriptional repressor/proline dehydrogenase/delta 1-pyrroline-5-carboxylate dehydrogenase
MAEILSPELPAPPSAARARITSAWNGNESEVVAARLAEATFPAKESEAVEAQAAALVSRVRERSANQSAVESFMRQYDL